MSSPAQDLEIRAATAADAVGIWDVLQRAFGDDWDEESSAPEFAVLEPERNLVVVDDGMVVANAGAYTRDMTVPGGLAVPAAHVTLVGVNPMYRRRGLLTRLMHRQLREARDAGREPFAVLWASEGRIYQRFGYGAAAVRHALEADRREVTLLPRVPVGAGRLREQRPADARKDLVEVFERVRLDRAGISSRNDAWWDKVLSDPAGERHGATARRAALYEGADGVEGYALWRTKMEWKDGPNGLVEVQELLASTAEAYTALWRFLLDVDLTRRVMFWSSAADEPVLYLVDEPRALRGVRAESLWVRLLDVPAALTARRYSAPLDVVIEVADTLLADNAGRWRLRVDGSGEATCEAAGSAPADLACDIADLGAAYLGGTSLVALGVAGRVRELRPGALAATGRAFLADRQPVTIEVF